MRLVTLDLVKIMLGVILALIIVKGLFRAKTPAGTWVGTLAIVALGFFGLWFISENGRSLEDSLACAIFPRGNACRLQASLPAQPPPPVQRSQPAQKSEAPPSPPPPRLPGPESYLSFEGWWPVGTPDPPHGIASSPTHLWTWASRLAGACEPLRLYIQLHGDTPDAATARERLSRRSAKSERRKVVATEVLRASRVQASGNRRGEDLCEEFYRTAKHDYPEAGCKGRAAGQRFAGASVRNLAGRSVVVPNSCRCGEGWFGKTDCSVEVQTLCTMENDRVYELEQCG